MQIQVELHTENETQLNSNIQSISSSEDILSDDVYYSAQPGTTKDKSEVTD
jgi:hypothetical protein